MNQDDVSVNSLICVCSTSGEFERTVGRGDFSLDDVALHFENLKNALGKICVCNKKAHIVL